MPASGFGDTRVTRTGTGVVRVDRAAALTSFASPGGVSFGRLNPLFPINRDERVKLTNLTGKSRNFKGKHIANRSYPGVKVECPSSVQRRCEGHGTIRHRPEASIRARRSSRACSTTRFASQTEVDGWCELSDGKDTLRVAYIAVVDAASAVLTLPGRKLRSVNLFNVGPALGIAEGFTLAKLGSEGEGRTAATISAVGFRNADPSLYFGLPTLEFGIALAKPFEHLSTFEFDLLIDTNGDGVEDVILIGVDLSAFARPSIRARS